MRKIIAFLLAFSFGLSAFAQGSEAMGFATVVRDPSKAAMGYAGKASTASPAWASFSNPAVVAASPKIIDAGVSYGIFAPAGAKYSGVAAGLSFRPGKLGISLGFLSQSAEPYDIIDESSFVLGTFTPNQTQLNLGFSYAFSKKLFAGASFKYLGDNIADGASYGSVGIDVFGLYVSGPLRASIGAANLAGKVTGADGTAYAIPAELSLSGAYSLAFGSVNTVDFALDVDYFFSGAVTAALGAEYCYNNFAFVRAGYHFGTAKAILPSFATVGAGVKFASFTLNAAYLLGNDMLSGTLCFGVGYSF